jgi:hypothetical protein
VKMDRALGREIGQIVRHHALARWAGLGWAGLMASQWLRSSGRHMAGRDEFSPATKRFVALRAGYRCSFTGCRVQTVGPSSESPSAYTSIGEVAHISGASPGGPRYQPAMSPEERVHISNAMWVCANHARLIDRDTSTFTVEALLIMKSRHEAAMAEALRGSTGAGSSYDLVALGPEIVCTGHLLKVDSREWVVRLAHFVEGDFYALVKFVSDYDGLAAASRYVILNELGDGRALRLAPSMERVDDGYLLRLKLKEVPQPRRPSKCPEVLDDPTTGIRIHRTLATQ